MADEFIAILGEAAEIVAPRLLGCCLVRQIGGQRLVGQIVETEAYSQTDAASHSYRGQTPRTTTLFGPPGYLYVYFTYGMHYCCNVVCGHTGQGSAVLIRAVEPLEGEEFMKENRHAEPRWPSTRLTNGPAKVCKALLIDKALNGHDLHRSPLQLIMKPALPSDRIVQTTRVGISRAQDKPWRFYIRGNEYVSRPL